MTFFVLLGLFCLLGVVFGWVAIFRLGTLSKQLKDLQAQLHALRRGPVTESQQQPSAAIKPDSQEAVTPEPQPEKTIAQETVVTREIPPAIQAGETRIPPAGAAPLPPRTEPDWFDHLKENWMIWLGGICVGLSGIFLAKYSIDQGYLGPTTRIIAAIILGLTLHGAAEWLRRNKEQHASFAALAAGGSITLFAALLTAMHMFDMFNPTIVFVSLAFVALATMALAVFHGPVLAVIGILGAYLVPLMVGEGPGGAAIVLVYTLIISASALMLMRFVYRDWLWLGVLAGGLGWWFLTIQETDIDGLRGIYLTVFAYLLVAILSGDWLLQMTRYDSDKSKSFDKYFTAGNKLEALLPVSLLLIILAQCFSIAFHGLAESAIVNWSPLAILLLFTGGRRQYLSLHPWVLLIFTLAAWLVSQFNFTQLEVFSGGELVSFYWYCGVSAAIYTIISLYNTQLGRQKALWISIAVLAPLLFLALSYVLTEKLETSLQWSTIAVLLGAIYLAIAGTLVQNKTFEQEKNIVPAWFFIGGHLGYSLAVAMYLREASMTLAIAVQIISLSWLIRRFEITSFGWLLKLVVAVVLTRLTLNPWLLNYPTDIHWTLWTYGGSTLCCFAGGLLLQKTPELRKWAFGATVHLFALTVWAETRYWIYDGNVYAQEYEFVEAALMLNIFWTLGLVYHLRERYSDYLVKLYRIYSKILIALALANYAVIVMATLSSESWIWSHIGETKIFNMMLLAFGTPVLLGLVTWKFYLSQYAKPASIFTGLALFIFISLEIRHLWHGNIRLSLPTTDAELYTYSAVWLVMAVLAILGGIWRFGEGSYRAGMLLLVLVIAKLFFIDLADLEGLLRVASFMGMGLALLGIAYLYQRLRGKKGSE
jgi:uncharacterized membrane protein